MPTMTKGQRRESRPTSDRTVRIELNNDGSRITLPLSRLVHTFAGLRSDYPNDGDRFIVKQENVYADGSGLRITVERWSPGYELPPEADDPDQYVDDEPSGGPL